MKNARESLADVRRWICDNLSNGDAGRLCNMLSSVSRHISEVEMKNEHLRSNYVDKVEYISALEQKTVCMHDENAQLRKLAQRMWRLERFGCYGCRRECDVESCYASDCKEAVEIEQDMRNLGIEVPQ